MNGVLKLKENIILQKGCGHCPQSALQNFYFKNVTDGELSALLALKFLEYGGKRKVFWNLEGVVSHFSHGKSKKLPKLLEFQFPSLNNGYNNTYCEQIRDHLCKDLTSCLAHNRCSLNNIS